MRKNNIKYWVSLVFVLCIFQGAAQNKANEKDKNQVSLIIDTTFSYYKKKDIIELKLSIIKNDSIDQICQNLDFPISSGIYLDSSFYITNKVCGLFYLLEDKEGNYLFQDTYYDFHEYNIWHFFDKDTKTILKKNVTTDVVRKLIEESVENGKFILNDSIEKVDLYLKLEKKLRKGQYKIFLFYGHCPVRNSRDHYWHSLSNKIKIMVE